MGNTAISYQLSASAIKLSACGFSLQPSVAAQVVKDDSGLETDSRQLTADS
jgi:hypothetical protein